MGSADLAWLEGLPDDQLRALFVSADEILTCTRLLDYRPYQKQRHFHERGAGFRERLLMAANQVGKSLSAAAETAMHLSGRYPDWWKGKRFDRPVTWMVASETGKLTRDGVQVHLLGWPKRAKGTGMILAEDVMDTPAQQGIADLFDYVRVQHHGPDGQPDGESLCYLRSYDQGRERVQAMTLDGVWLDEEPPEDYYMECLTRTNVVMGPVYLTFTPLKGMSRVVKRFLIDKMPGTCVTHMTLADAEHYSADQRAAIEASYPEHERKARAEGLPTLGSGLIFPVREEQIKVQPFQIPAYWPRINGIDFGWDHPTAAVSCAWDRDADIWYVTAAHRQREASPIIHAASIKPWGAWIPVAWPHDGNNDTAAGANLAMQYKAQGLAMLPERATFEDGSNSVEAGLMEMLTRMQTGRFKVFSNLDDWFGEFRMYHREDGKVVKIDDDLLSATRYALMMRRFAKVQPTKKSTVKPWTPLDAAMGF